MYEGESSFEVRRFAERCTDPRYAQTPANVRLRWGQDLYRDPKPAPDEKEKEN